MIPRRLRFMIAGLALLLLVCSLTALLYSFWPLGDVQVQATLAPTLWVVP